jgi:hypothetical protein
MLKLDTRTDLARLAAFVEVVRQASVAGIVMLQNCVRIVGLASVIGCRASTCCWGWVVVLLGCRTGYGWWSCRTGDG